MMPAIWHLDKQSQFAILRISLRLNWSPQEKVKYRFMFSMKMFALTELTFPNVEVLVFLSGVFFCLDNFTVITE